MKLTRTMLVILTAMACIGCHGIGGTYDHSRSLSRTAPVANEGSIAIVGPPDSAALPGLSESLGSAVRDAVAASAPGREVIDSSAFYSRLQAHKGYFQHFGGWMARYAQTGVPEAKYQPAYGKATGVRYLVILKDAQVRRERLDLRSAMKESDCGFGCVIGDANNIWGNRLIVIAELHDLLSGSIIWKGLGEANAISSRVSNLDFGVVQYNLTQPDLGSYSAQLISKVANGIARELGQTTSHHAD